LNWAAQKAAGADLLPVGDFSFYDHVLDLLCALGGIPKRFGFDAANLSLPEYFQLARGNATQFAMEMTKWFDTNYHFIVPEWSADTEFKVNAKNLIAQIKEAKAQGYDIKPTLVGPVTLAWLGKKKDGINCRVKDLLLPKLLPAYAQLLRDLAASGTTVLLSSHILSEMEEMVDGVVFMSRGTAVASPSDQVPAETEGPDGAVRPAPVRRTWRMRALDAGRLGEWAHSAQLTVTPEGDGQLRIPVADDAAAAHLLREAVEAGVEVVSFAPLSGTLEETYLALEGERR